MKKTLVLRVNPQEPDLEKIRIAARLVRDGGLVAFPTETVYGLGADALNPEAIQMLFKAKGRPPDNPLIIHVGNKEDVSGLVELVTHKCEMLIEKFWPGPLTLILRRSKIVPDVTVSGLDTIAVRMPRHATALSLIRESGCPIAAPSANLSGRPSPTTAQHVLEDLECRIDAVLDGGPTPIGMESTVLDMTADQPQVLRPGGTPFESLRKVLKNVKLHPAAVAYRSSVPNEPRSPGLKYRHYAPAADVTVVEGGLTAVVGKIQALADFHAEKGRRVGILCTDETIAQYKAEVVKSLGSRKDLSTVAQNLYRLLREFDLEGVDIILAEGIPSRGFGLAVMNRLRKASGFKIVNATY